MSTPLLKSEAKQMTDAYVNFGNAAHFKYNNNLIEGFLFTRQQLANLVLDPNNHLFLMLGLSGTVQNQYLNLLIGSVNAGTYMLDLDNCIISDQDPYTENVNLAENSLIINEPDGVPVTLAQLTAMRQTFELSHSNAHLTSTAGVKIKAYHITPSDLIHLTLDQRGNPADTFIFMPVIRDTPTPPTSPYDRPYMSIAVARFNTSTSQTEGTIIEYCLPCPDHCPTNFPIQ